MSARGPERYAELTLPGGWRTARPIGRGNFAWVYAGVSPDGETCAIKVLHQRSEQAEKRFLREIKIVREIPHNDYCVRYKAHGETDDGAPWLALEFIRGVTLSAIIAKGKPIGAVRLMRLMVQICKGFAGLHRFGLAHRDVKPDNIMITRPEGSVKLLDFGLVQDSQGLLKLFEEEDMVRGRDFADDLDHGMLAGTPEYMAPEQISDATSAPDEQRTDTTADVFSLGVIFYQLLAGRKLFPFDPKAQEPKGVHKEMLAYLDWRLSLSDSDLERPPEISPQLWTIIVKSLHKDPKQRQGTALELAGDIEVYLQTGRGIENDDLSVTVRGLTGIPMDVIQAARSQHKRPVFEPAQAPAMEPLQRPASAPRPPAAPAEPPKAAAAISQPLELPPPPTAGDLSALADLQSATTGIRWLMAMMTLAVIVGIVVAMIL